MHIWLHAIFRAMRILVVNLFSMAKPRLVFDMPWITVERNMNRDRLFQTLDLSLVLSSKPVGRAFFCSPAKLVVGIAVSVVVFVLTIGNFIGFSLRRPGRSVGRSCCWRWYGRGIRRRT